MAINLNLSRYVFKRGHSRKVKQRGTVIMKLFSVLLAILIIAVGFQGELLERAWSVFIAITILYFMFRREGI